MAADNPEPSAAPRPTVFLSYASEDRRAAQLIRDTLPGFGMEVWYDESDLVGGDAWDQKIRRQIRECDYFMPVISAHTEARHEGYFRREWRVAVERTLDMADDHVFLLPVVIDNTTEAGARVPDRFRAVQWLRLPDGHSTPALEALCRRLVTGETTTSQSGERPRPQRGQAAPPPPPPPPSENADDATPKEFPPFPREEPGQRVRFWFQVLGWALHSTWIALQRLPRWLRIIVYIWVGILLISRGCTPSHDRSHESDTSPPTSTPTPPGISSSQEEKLKELAKSHPGNWTAADTAQLLTQIAKQIPAAAREASSSAAVLAIPFASPAGDAAAQKLAGSVFTQVYGRLAIARHGHVALADEPMAASDTSVALIKGRAHGSSYIVLGGIAGSAPDQQLSIKVLSSEDGSVSWSKSYPVAGADPAGIAAEVSAHVPSSDDDDD